MCACTGSPPDITEVMQTIVFRYDPSTEQSFESLHFYAVIADSDGIGDLSELHLLNDDQAVFWKLDEDNWDIHETEDKIWIGSHTLRMPQSRVIPRGRYRVQVYDRAGESDSRIIEILHSNSIENNTLTFPSLQYTDGTLNLSSTYEDNLVRWYYRVDRKIFEYRGNAGVINKDVFEAQMSDDIIDLDSSFTRQFSSFYIYSFPADDIDDYYVLVGPIKL